MKTPLRPLTALPLNPDLATGSFADYPVIKHSSFWGTYEWPFDCYDPWDKNNPRHHVFQRKTNTKSAEDFINLYELRHLLYSYIPETNLSEYAGLFMSCKTIAAEVSDKYLTARRNDSAAQRTYWSDTYHAPVLITQPAKLSDLAVTEVQLPASMFTQEWQVNNAPLGIYPGIPMSDLPLTHLKISTYIDTSDPVDGNLIKTYAQTINARLGAPTAFTKVSFDWGTIMPSHEWYTDGMLDSNMPGVADAGSEYEKFVRCAELMLGFDPEEGWMYKLSGEGHVVVITWTRDLRGLVERR